MNHIRAVPPQKAGHPTTLRLSLGSAVVLGLYKATMDAIPTTLYTMLEEHCMGACRFCAQARDSAADPRFLSRIVWPAFDLEAVLDRLARAQGLHRICVQTLRYAGMPADLVYVVERMRQVSELPISVCMNPVQSEWLNRLKAAGVERVGLGLDCAAETTFERVKPGFHWDRYHRFLREIVSVFSGGSMHLIVGLGDSDEALIRKIQEIHDHRCTVALFAFTPVRGARLKNPAPNIGRYRAIQLARYLIVHNQVRAEAMDFVQGRLVALHTSLAVLAPALASGEPFQTSGCPGCNRPFYNERPGGDMYNYPAPLTAAESISAFRELITYLIDPEITAMEAILQEIATNETAMAIAETGRA